MEEAQGELKASWGRGIVLQEFVPDAIVGRVMEIIELLGLGDREEKTKRIIKRAIREEIYDENRAIYLESEAHSKLREDYYNNSQISPIK